jgi:hypothetical protein
VLHRVELTVTDAAVLTTFASDFPVETQSDSGASGDQRDWAMIKGNQAADASECGAGTGTGTGTGVGTEVGGCFHRHGEGCGCGSLDYLIHMSEHALDSGDFLLLYGLHHSLGRTRGATVRVSQARKCGATAAQGLVRVQDSDSDS